MSTGSTDEPAAGRRTVGGGSQGGRHTGHHGTNGRPPYAERVMPTVVGAGYGRDDAAVGPCRRRAARSRYPRCRVLSFGRPAQPPPPTARSCRQCGRAPSRPDAAICARCGIPFGEAPRADAELPTCPICYTTVADDGLLPALNGTGRSVPIAEHIAEHDRHPVGDDTWLESLRQGDRIRVGRWYAPFDLVRRYLVTGAVDGGRRRTFQHDAVVNAMTQLARWGQGAAAAIVGDQAEWAEAREAVTELLERYHRR